MTEKSPWDAGPEWIHIKNRLPPENTILETISEGGEKAELILADGLWWLKDRSMYVYYVPRFWRVANG